jgi:hypothetical protein
MGNKTCPSTSIGEEVMIGPTGAPIAKTLGQGFGMSGAVGNGFLR